MSAAPASVNVRGMHDKFTTGDPDVSFWKSSYPRHSPFAMEPKDVEPSAGQVDFGRKVTFDLDRVADLVWQLYLVAEITALNGAATVVDAVNGDANESWVDDLGRAMIERVSMDVGGHEIDELTGEYLHAWEELSKLQENHYGELTGKFGVQSALDAAAIRPLKMYVPLPFYHTEHPSQALPQVALHLTKVSYEVRLRAKADLINAAAAVVPATAADGALQQLRLSANHVYLHQRERHWFTRVSHKYLITQVQDLRHTLVSGASQARVDMTFNHPVQEMIVLGRTEANTTARNYFNFDGVPTGLVPSAYTFEGELFEALQLTINGNTRVESLDPFYYRIVQPSQHHTRIPRKRIYVWSYAIDPESTNPTGSLNHSRIDRANMHFSWPVALADNIDLQIYARNHNIVHVERGSYLLRFNS
jgi:hypothetical protein